jgi:predicted transposase/invertase (TIGR01784 family)
VTERLQLVYLDELPLEIGDQSLEVNLMQLFSLKEKLAFDRAKALLQHTQRQTSDAEERQRVLEWIVTVFVHKFPKLSREEIKKMLGTKADLKKTRFYQEIKEEIAGAAKEEGKEELLMAIVPTMLKAGISIAEIARQSGIPIKQVKAIAKQGDMNV